VAPDGPIVAVEDRQLHKYKENAVRRRLILIAATWAAVVGLVAGSAHAQSPTPPGGQFVLIGVVLLEGGRGLAFVQEPNFTNNKVVTVRLGDSVGPYRVTKILTHQVELTGPGGTISVPLAGLPGAVGVASSAGTMQRPAGELPPHAGLKNPMEIVVPRGDPRRNFPASEILVGAGAVVGGVASEAGQPQATQLQTASPVRSVPVAAAMQAPAPDLPPHGGLNNPKEIVIPRGDPRRNFPASQMLIGG
jgi:hypothetical protein